MFITATPCCAVISRSAVEAHCDRCESVEEIRRGGGWVGGGGVAGVEVVVEEGWKVDWKVLCVAAVRL